MKKAISIRPELIESCTVENKEQYDFIKIPYHGRYLKRLENLLGKRVLF